MALPDLPLHAAFEAQAARTPDATALVFGTERVTYSELDARANRLAHLLRSRGIGADKPVAVLMERSVEMVVALYGILKAGAAYVPVDPEYPADRVAYMLDDSAAALVLTQERWIGELADAADAIALDAPGVLDAFPADRVADADAAGTERLAYVIYTSGSTGRPKGAMNAHRGVVNRIAWMQDAFGLTADDAVLQKTPFSFDVSVWEFFWPLAVGARLVIAPPGRAPRSRGAERAHPARGHHDAALRPVHAARVAGRGRCVRVHVAAPGDEQRRGAPGGPRRRASSARSPRASCTTCTARRKPPWT